MLETEIKNLIAEIKMLREALAATPPADKPKADKPKADKPKADKPKATSITVEELQKMCVDITRVDKTMRSSIVALLAEHNATRIDQVPESKFEELAESLAKLGM